jgi:hypothetical protein
MKILRSAGLLIVALFGWQCRDGGAPGPTEPKISTDAELIDRITRAEPYGTYPLFPGVDSVVAGGLPGSDAHRPMVRVSMNQRAYGALDAGRLPEGGAFPDGSVVVKEIRDGAVTTLLAVMVRDRDNPLSGQGWLWAEYTPEGTVLVPMRNRGVGCTPCHAREQGLRNDLVRTFERQRPR